uniref:3-beta hydroxysteroid dehydrogenase/isomerase domain-containing protein n=1 Tax=Cyanoderma ruficeps TaxID=181631 RepID=A0A8C3NU56_9PASS
MPAWVYLVTGGCGFVGERIVELLSRQDYIKEVRVFDSVAREEVKKLSTAAPRVTVTRGDIRAPGALLAALQGVQVVLHSAAVVDCRDTVPFGDMRAVNIGVSLRQGPQHCPALTHTLEAAADTSTCVWCCLSLDPAHPEVWIPHTPDLSSWEFLSFPLYPCSGLAMLLLLSTAHQIWAQLWHTHHECLPEAGNVAWMHVPAARHLQLQPDLLAGQVYYCYNDTSSRKGFLVRQQLLSSADPSVRLGSHVPCWKMWLMIQLHRTLRAILSPFWRPRPFLSVPLLNTIVTSFSFETDKASRHFGYKPLFTWQESRLRTAQWLKAAAGGLGPPQLHEKKN